jgi:hypothetical protein
MILARHHQGERTCFIVGIDLDQYYEEAKLFAVSSFVDGRSGAEKPNLGGLTANVTVF